jgi:hypothetical protein
MVRRLALSFMVRTGASPWTRTTKEIKSTSIRNRLRPSRRALQSLLRMKAGALCLLTTKACAIVCLARAAPHPACSLGWLSPNPGRPPSPRKKRGEGKGANPVMCRRHHHPPRPVFHGERVASAAGRVRAFDLSAPMAEHRLQTFPSCLCLSQASISRIIRTRSGMDTCDRHRCDGITVVPVRFFMGSACHFLHGEDGRSPWTRTTKETGDGLWRQPLWLSIHGIHMLQPWRR